MTITLGPVTFDPRATHVREQLEEVGGRDERRILISGIVSGLPTREGIEARLDAIVQAASAEDWTAALSLRPGRRLWVRRDAYRREVDAAGRTGSFELKLGARDPFEESVDEAAIAWTIEGDGAMRPLETEGNAPARPVVTLVAATDLVCPGLDDGERRIVYDGVAAAGSVVVFDSAAGRALLDGEDVTPYAFGAFPLVAPGGATLTYQGDAGAAHEAAGTIVYRHRWL